MTKHKGCQGATLLVPLAVAGGVALAVKRARQVQYEREVDERLRRYCPPLKR